MSQLVIYGVYDINGIIRYVGRTDNLRRRFEVHQIERDWPVGIKVLEWVTLENCDDREKYWIDHFGGIENLENKQFSSNGFKPGHKHSAETVEKIKAGLRGHKTSQETKDKISRALTGRKMPSRVFSEEHKKKISQAAMGRTYSVESRLRMSLSRLGKKRGPYKKHGK